MAMPALVSRWLADRTPDSAARAGALALLCLCAMAASVLAAPGVSGVLAAALVPLVVAIACIDARSFLIPDGLNAAGLMLGLVHAVAAAQPLLDGVLMAGARGAVVGALFYALKAGYRALRKRDGLGLGDVKLAVVMGVWLDWATIPLAIEIAAVSALVVCLWRGLDGGTRLPFGLFLAPAIWIGWMAERLLLSPM